MNFLKHIPNYITLGVLWLYQKTLSPNTGVARFIPGYPAPSCVFYPTCSVYAQACFKTHPFIKAVRLTLYRLSRCHPGTPPTVDMPE